MICPNCRYEYNPGVTICPDCGADLLYSLPPEIPDKRSADPLGPANRGDSIIIFESDSGPDIAIAKEILDEAGIVYITNRRANIYFDEHKMVIQVGGQDAERARALLAELAESGSRLADDVDMEEASGGTQEEEQ